MTRNTLSLVLLSGGLDSAVALAWALGRGWRVLPISFSFPGRPRAEARAARRIAEAAGVPAPHVIGVPVLHMTGPSDAPRHGGRRNRHARNIRAAAPPPGFIPHRNLVYYSLALAAAAESGARWIVGGHLKTDGVDFADARPSFFSDLQALAARGSPPRRAGACRIVLPFAKKTKGECLREGARRGVRFELTWSCYRDGRRPCGRCAGCVERRAAFREAGLRDEAGASKTPGRRRGGAATKTATANFANGEEFRQHFNH